MRFLVDECVADRIAVEGRRLGLEIASVKELDRRRLSDREQLEWAGSQGMCVLTVNAVDYIAETANLKRERLPHAGVLMMPRNIRKAEAPQFAASLKRFVDANPEGLQAYEKRWFDWREWRED